MYTCMHLYTFTYTYRYTQSICINVFLKCINNFMSTVFSQCCETRSNVCQVSKINRLYLRFPHNLVVKLKNMMVSASCDRVRVPVKFHWGNSANSRAQVYTHILNSRTMRDAVYVYNIVYVIHRYCVYSVSSVKFRDRK